MFFDFLRVTIPSQCMAYVILFHYDCVVGGFGRWLYGHFKERGVFMGGELSGTCVEQIQGI